MIPLTQLSHARNDKIICQQLATTTSLLTSRYENKMALLIFNVFPRSLKAKYAMCWSKVGYIKQSKFLPFKSWLVDAVYATSYEIIIKIRKRIKLRDKPSSAGVKVRFQTPAIWMKPILFYNCTVLPKICGSNETLIVLIYLSEIFFHVSWQTITSCFLTRRWRWWPTTSFNTRFAKISIEEY